MLAPVALLSGWWLGRIGRLEVVGESMSPTLLPGDRVLVLRTRRLRLGSVVAVVDPRSAERTVLKRVSAVGPGSVMLLGDNAGASTDSRTFGPVELRAVRGRVFYRYHPPDRRGLVRPEGPPGPEPADGAGTGTG